MRTTVYVRSLSGTVTSETRARIESAHSPCNYLLVSVYKRGAVTVIKFGERSQGSGGAVTEPGAVSPCWGIPRNQLPM
jgi:hypothetical protein